MIDRATTNRLFAFIQLFIIITLMVVFCTLVMGGCTLSLGAEGRAFYPADKSPRKGFYDAGGMDGIYSRPATGSFATLGGVEH
jgi:hypothetical protein